MVTTVRNDNNRRHNRCKYRSLNSDFLNHYSHCFFYFLYHHKSCRRACTLYSKCWEHLRPEYVRTTHTQVSKDLFLTSLRCKLNMSAPAPFPGSNCIQLIIHGNMFCCSCLVRLVSIIVELLIIKAALFS